MKEKNILGVLLASALITACTPATSSRYREGDNMGQETGMTFDDERRLTEEALPQIKKDYPAAQNPDLQRYISNLGMKIVRSNNLEGNPYNYEFEVVDVENVNAFALPAGKIFVTAPLIAMASNEAELAGVIGHEIGHVTARHAAERMYVMEKEQNKTWLFRGWWWDCRCGRRVRPRDIALCGRRHRLHGKGSADRRRVGCWWGPARAEISILGEFPRRRTGGGSHWLQACRWRWIRQGPGG